MRRTTSKLVGFGMLLVLAVMLVPGSASGTVPLHLTYPGTGACAQSSTGLNDCIASATTGSTVTVKPGTYFESGTAVMVSGVTVTGSCANPSAVVIDQGLAGDGFDVGVANVTIECLKVRHGGNGHYGIANIGANNGLHVTKFIAVDEENGVYQPTAGTSGFSVTGSTFLGMNGYALFSFGTTGATISNNTFGGVDGDCMFFTSLTSGTVSNNTIGPCGGNAIATSGGASNTISGNKLHAIGGYCIYADVTDTTITKNTINGCKSAAVYVDGDYPTITANLITGHVGAYTIEVQCGNGALISGNKANGNSGNPFIYVCQNATGHETITNNIETNGNVLYGVECTPCDNAIVTGNQILGGGHESAIYVVGQNPVANSNVAAGDWDAYGFFVNCTSSCTAAQVEKNKESGSNSLFGYAIINDGCGSSFPCMTISGNAATGNYESGFALSTSYAQIMSNTASFNGFSSTGCHYSGFEIGGDFNQLTANTATKNACDGFWFNGGHNTLTSNIATGNIVHGFQVGYDANILNKNTATGNDGDGFNNDGTNTVFTNNKASGNRQDCTNDNAAPSSESASILTNTGNTCADHHIFDLPSTLIGW